MAGSGGDKPRHYDQDPCDFLRGGVYPLPKYRRDDTSQTGSKVDVVTLNLHLHSVRVLDLCLTVHRVSKIVIPIDIHGLSIEDIKGKRCKTVTDPPL
jgi:hypothetical protein